MSNNLPSWLRDDSTSPDDQPAQPEDRSLPMPEPRYEFSDPPSGLPDADQERRRANALDQLATVRKLIDAARLRDAETELDALITLTSGDADLEDLLATAQSERPRIEVKRAELIRAYQTRLDDLLESPIKLTDRPFFVGVQQFREYLEDARTLIDEAADTQEMEIRDVLAQWQQVILDAKPDAQYQRRLNRVSSAIAREKQRLYVEQARELCERIWAYADEQKAQRVAPITIVSYYKAAEDAANLALGRYPDDPQLKTLDLEARNRRVREAVAGQIKTSAVQEGEYDRALADLSQFNDDELVPNYDFLSVDGTLSEQFSGRIPAKQMRDQLERQAFEWALAKKSEYIADAELALADHNPVAAEKALDADKVTRLMRFLRQSADRIDLQDVQARIRDARRLYDEAEKLAKEAQSRAAADPHVAWRLYGEARTKYEWAEVLRETRNMIVAEFRQRLMTRLQAAQKAFDARDFLTLNDEVQAISREFRYIDDPLIEQQLEAANALLLEADEIDRQKQALRMQLDRLERDLPNSDPDALQDELDGLKVQFAKVLREDERFDDLAQKVSLRQSAERQTEQFKKMLAETDYARVEREVQKARAALTDYPDDDLLRDAVRNLEIHLEFLTGRRELEAGQYARALEIFDRVQRMVGHPDRATAEELWDDTDRRIKEQERAGDRLKSAEERLTRDPVGVYEDVVALGVLIDRTLDKKRSNLLERAKAEAKAVLLRQLRDARKVGATPNAAQVRGALESLNTLGFTEEYAEYASYFEPVLLAQEAGVLAQSALRNSSAADWREVIRLYSEAVTRAKELRAETRLLKEFEQNLHQARTASVQLQLDSLRTSVASVGSDAPELLARFSQLENDLNMIFEANRSSGEVALWIAQLSELRARYSYDPEQRQKWFRQAEAQGKQALGLLTSGAAGETAQRLILNAEQGAQLARVMLEIDANFAANTPERLREAQTRWRDELQPATEDEYFRPLRTWWSDRIKLHLGTAGTRSDFIRPDGTLIVSKVVNRVLLDAQDATALSLISDLDQFVGQLTSKVDMLAQNATTAQAVVGSDGMAKLATQLSQIKESSSDIEALANLVKFFGKDHPHSQAITNAYSQISYENQVLGETNEALQSLHQQLTATRHQLSVEQVTGGFIESERLIRAVPPLQQNHPATVQVREEIAAAQAERARLVEELNEIQAQIDAGEYGSARRRLKAIGLKRATDYGLAHRLRIVHPKTGDTTSAWMEVEAKLGELGGVLEAIIDFAAPFDEYAGGATGSGRLTGVPMPPRVVVNWEAQADRIMDALELGNFTEARQMVDEALLGSDRIGIGLNAAVERLQRPPNGSGATVEARYAAAENAASSSERARTLLRALLTQRLTLFETQRDDANRAHDEINRREQQWSDGVESWARAINAIGEQFQRAGGVKKRPRGRAMQTAIQDAWAAFERCREACPRHGYLINMVDVTGWDTDPYRGLWLFRQAVKLTRASLRGFTREKARS